MRLFAANKDTHLPSFEKFVTFPSDHQFVNFNNHMPRTTSLSRIVLFLVCVFGVVLCSDDSSQTKEFWHISDVHLNAQYNARGDPRSNCVEPIEPGNSTHQYTNGQYECDPPASLVASAVRFMQTRNSSFVIYTG